MKFTPSKNIAICTIALFSTLYLGCQNSTAPPVPSGTPPAPAPAVSTTPEGTEQIDSEAVEKAFKDITAHYEAGPTGDLGYPLIQPFLAEEKLEGIVSLNLEDPKAARKFESDIFPILKKSFSSPAFFPKERLLEGQSPINYRGLRSLVGMVAKWAEETWDKGDHEAAVGIASLPLSLAHAIKSRPETVSVNLFSSSYGEMTLDLFADWAEDSPNQSKLLALMLESLKKYRVPLAHLRETILVDFAKISNSLNDEQGRAALGIGQSDHASKERWRSQLTALYLSAKDLVLLKPQSTEAFNGLITSADGPIQGLVIDYPHIVTIQLHYFAKYRALEIGLTLLSPEGKPLKKLPSEEIVKKLFASDPEAVEMLNQLIEVKVDGEEIRVVGKSGRFDLLAPGEPPSFFEYSPSKD